MNLRDLLPPADLPAATARMPAWLLRLALSVVGISMTLVAWGDDGWIALGIALSVVAGLLPDFLLGWLVIVFLAIGQLRDPGTLRWQLLVLVAGVHLLHLLSMLSLELPRRSWIQPAVFRAPLLRFAAIQIPAQMATVIAVSLLGRDRHGHPPATIAAFAVIGAMALAGLALLLLSGSRRAEAGSL